jgi:hypothetical protein
MLFALVLLLTRVEIVLGRSDVHEDYADEDDDENETPSRMDLPSGVSEMDLSSMGHCESCLASGGGW